MRRTRSHGRSGSECPGRLSSRTLSLKDHCEPHIQLLLAAILAVRRTDCHGAVHMPDSLFVLVHIVAL